MHVQIFNYICSCQSYIYDWIEVLSIISISLPSLMTNPPLISEVVATPPGTGAFSQTWTSNLSAQRDRL